MSSIRKDRICMEDKGIKITPEMIEKMKAAKSPTELMELCKGYGLGFMSTNLLQ